MSSPWPPPAVSTLPAGPAASVAAASVAAAGPPPPPAAPSRRVGRVDGVDLARALAVLGMLVAHFVVRGDPGVPDSVRAFVDGRAMPLFVVLFGVSIALLARGAEHPDRALVVRALVFLPLGLLLQELTVGIAIILHYYALFCLAAIGLRRLGDRALLVGAALVAAAPVVTEQLVAPRWPGYLAWDGGHGIAPPWGLLANLTVNGTYPALPTLSFVMVGLWLGRRNLADARLALRLVVVGTVLGLVGYVGGRAVGDRVGATGVVVDARGVPQLRPARRDEVMAVYGYPQHQIDEIGTGDPRFRRAVYEQLVRYAQDQVVAFHAERVLDTTGHSEMPAWTVGATGCACAALGLCLVAARRARRALAPLVALGRMSLTAYVVQAIAIRWTPEAGTVSIGHQYAVTGALAAGLTLVAWLWSRRFRRGPLEALLHLVARP